jgi:Protein of unknown function (DUF2800)
MMSDHVELSPSSASRWLACPGSIALSRSIPEPPSSAAAEEGTRAHALAEAALTCGVHARQLVGGIPPLDKATLEMADHVQHFVDFCEGLVDGDDPRVWKTEQKLTMDALNPPAPMSGTADFICWSPERLDIVDLKYGAGVYVNEQDNPQLLYYAVMGMLWAEAQNLRVPSEIRITIVQPRMEYLGDIVRSVSYSIDDVLGFSNKLLTGAITAMRAVEYQKKRNDEFRKFYLNVGSHCRWCRAITICPAQRQNAMEVAQQDFDVVTPQSLPAPVLLTNDELGSILARATWLGQWVDALRKEAEDRLGRNEQIDGWKLVPKQARRKWNATLSELMEVVAPLGLGMEDVSEEKLKGIGEIEKLLKKKGAVLPDGLTIKESSGYNLAPDTDRRPSRTDIAASEFTVISSSSSQE